MKKINTTGTNLASSKYVTSRSREPLEILKGVEGGKELQKKLFQYNREKGQGQGNTNYQEEGNPERVRKELKGGKSCEN